MTTLIFATNNQYKVDEIRHVVGNLFQIKSLAEADIDVDIPEPYDTMEENAGIKSLTISHLTGYNCFSEDSGLEVAALNGAPGVKSARYAGEGKNSDDNVDLLLKNMAGTTDRRARFKTVISLRINNQEHLFEGTCEGIITTEKRGHDGFGYDPVFIPEGASQTFAEMTMEQKARYSHRKKATAQLISFLSRIGK
jgi:XTP/dITP diphosphohydrolase